MITPTDGPSSPENYAMVTPHGRGPAAYDIAAPLGEAGITSAFDQSNADAGAGVLYEQSERQHQAASVLESPAGFGADGFTVDGGTTAGWPRDVKPSPSFWNGGDGGA